MNHCSDIVFSLIAALDRQQAIGKGGALPWHLPADLKRFKALTLDKPILMGRKTAQSLGRALPIASAHAAVEFPGARVLGFGWRKAA